MSSICLYTILFTIPDKEKNKYVDMFLIWLSCVVKNAGLTADDKLVILIDEKSLKMLNQNIIKLLLGKLICEHSFIICPPVTNMKEGALMRYNIFDYSQTALMYLDIDILVLKDIHRDFEDKIYIHPEGPLTDNNYGASITIDKEGRPGFSSGKFVIGSKGLRDVLFSHVNTFSEKNSDIYFTLDQPYYNEALLYISPEYLNMDTFVPPLLSINMHHYNPKTTVLLDFMGMPGDESFHWDKILSTFCLLSCGLVV